MKKSLFLLFTILFAISCKKKTDNSSTYHQNETSAESRAYFKGIVIDSLTGDTLTNYKFHPSICASSISVTDQTYLARAYWYPNPVGGALPSCIIKPTHVGFLVTDSAYNIIGSVSSDVDLIENDTVVVNFVLN